jgi:transcription elongation factor GreA
MTETSAQTSAQQRIGDIYSAYLGTLDPEQLVADGMYVRQFCEFVGYDTNIDLLTGSRVDSFVEQKISDADPNAPERVKALKEWFKYLKKQELTDANLGTRVRMPRPARGHGRTGTAVRRDEAAIEMTADGIAALEEELARLEEERHSHVEAVSRAREDKDFRENAPLDAAREALGLADSRIRQIKESLKRAVVVERQDTGHASVGSTVKVTHVGKGTSHTYMLVNPQEANARENKISVKSPVGSQLLGCCTGDEVVIDVPSGTVHLRVDEVDS